MALTKKQILNLVIITVSFFFVISMAFITWCLVRRRNKAIKNVTFKNSFVRKGVESSSIEESRPYRKIQDCINTEFKTSLGNFNTADLFTSIEKEKNNLAGSQNTNLFPINSSTRFTDQQKSLNCVNHTFSLDHKAVHFDNDVSNRKTSDEWISDIFGTKSYYEIKYQLTSTGSIDVEENSIFTVPSVPSIAVKAFFNHYKSENKIREGFKINKPPKSTITCINVKEFSAS
nr:uncharacterized protein LOC124818783 [Hydra vulgaris]